MYLFQASSRSRLNWIQVDQSKAVDRFTYQWTNLRGDQHEKTVAKDQGRLLMTEHLYILIENKWKMSNYKL